MKISWIIAIILSLIFTNTEAQFQEAGKTISKPIMADSPQLKDNGWTSQTYLLHKKLVKLWVNEDVSTVLINNCKWSAENPKNCILVGAMILKAESGGGTRFNKCHNIFSMMGYCFETRTEAIKNFVKRYNKRWYKLDKPIHFYSPYANVQPVSGYCASEVSSWSPHSCPNGYKIATVVYQSLNKL